MSQGSICGGMGSEESTAACFAYPKERFKDKPTFVAATFYVSEILSAKTEEACLKGSPDWFVIKSETETTTINHITFKAFEIGDNWTSGGQSGPAYRTFHSGKCYELGIQNVFSRAEYDPGTIKEFTKKDSSEVEGRLIKTSSQFFCVSQVGIPEMIGATVRRKGRWTSAGETPGRRRTGSLHPMAIEVGCFSVTKKPSFLGMFLRPAGRHQSRCVMRCQRQWRLTDAGFQKSTDGQGLVRPMDTHPGIQFFQTASHSWVQIASASQPP
jgi:hypothetical protein